MAQKIKQLKLPEYVKVGYRKYTIERVATFSLDEAQTGETENISATIKYKETDKDGTANTLLHEMLHTCFYSYGLSDHFKDKQEEVIVNTLANALTAVIKDNPKFIDYIQEQLK